MRKPSYITKSGPYEIVSYLDGTIRLVPSWGNYGPVWDLNRGGGSGTFGRMALASDIRQWINSPYSEAELKEGEERIALYHKRRIAAGMEMPPAPIRFVSPKKRQPKHEILRDEILARLEAAEEVCNALLDELDIYTPQQVRVALSAWDKVRR